MKLGAIVLSAHSKTSADYFQIDLKTAGAHLSYLCYVQSVVSVVSVTHPSDGSFNY